MMQNSERVRIFISSTFQDMQAERDAIRNFFLPPIQDKARWSGCRVELCDLRWGINTDEVSEEEANKKILSICLSEIEDCKPYMIVLVGDRYGWKPGTNLLQLALSTSPSGKEVNVDSEMSATSLEIHYGLQAIQIPKSNIIFLFRDSMPEAAGPQYRTEPGEEDNLYRLKQDIENAVGKECILHYSLGWDEEKKCPTGIEESFLPKLRAFQEKMISEVIGDWLTCSEIQRESARQDASFFMPGEGFTCVDSCLNALPDFDPQHRLMVFSGEKTEYCRQVAARFAAKRKDDGFCVMAFEFPDARDQYKTLYFYLSQRIADLLNLPSPQWPGEDGECEDGIREKTREQLIHYLSRYSEQKQEKLLFVIIGGTDDVNLPKLPKDLEHSFLPYNFMDAFPAVYILRVCRDEQDVYKYRKKNPYYLWTDSVTPDGRQYLEYLAKKNHKELAPSVIDELLRKYGSASPEYLSLMFKRLMMLEADDVDFSVPGNPFLSAQYRLIQSLPADVDELQLSIMQTVAKRINSRFCTVVLYVLSVSPEGVPEEALREICEGLGLPYQPLYLELLQQYLPEYIQKNENGIILKLAGRSVSAYYLQNGDERILEQISHYYTKLVEQAPQKVSQYLNFTIVLARDIRDKEEAHRLSDRALRVWRDIYRDKGQYYFGDCCTESEIEAIPYLLELYSSGVTSDQTEENLKLYVELFSFLYEKIREEDGDFTTEAENRYLGKVYLALVLLLDFCESVETILKVVEEGEKMLRIIAKLLRDEVFLKNYRSLLYGCEMNILRRLGQPQPDRLFQKVADWIPHLIRFGNDEHWWMMQRYGGQYAVLADISEKEKKKLLSVSFSQTRHGTVFPSIGQLYLYQIPVKRRFLLKFPSLRGDMAINEGDISAAFLIEKENAIHQYIKYLSAADTLLSSRKYGHAEVFCRMIVAEIEKESSIDSAKKYYLATALWLQGLCLICLSCPKPGNEKMESALVIFRELESDVPCPLTKECLISLLYDLALARSSAYDAAHLLEEADAFLSELLNQIPISRWKRWKRMIQKSQMQLPAEK